MDKYINIFQNLVPSLLSIQNLLKGSAYIIGVFFIFKGLLALKQLGETRSHMSQHHTFKEPATYLFVGTCLIFFPTATNVFLSTVFGSDNIMSYQSMPGSNAFFNSLSSFGLSITLFIQVIGLIAFIRGWILIVRGASQGGHQQGGFGKGLMHIFGGILAINIVQTLNIINDTLYGG